MVKKKAPVKKRAIKKKRARVVRHRSAARADVIHKLNVAALDAATMLCKSMAYNARTVKTEKGKADHYLSKEQLQAAEIAISRVVPKLKAIEISGEIEQKKNITIRFEQ